MRSCLRIPRLFVPVKNHISRWASPAPDWGDKLAWERVASETGDAPSSLCLSVPDCMPKDRTEEGARKISETQWSYLENGVLERLNRGCMLVERTGACKRKGILCLIDLEEFSPDGGKTAVCSLMEPDGDIVRFRLAVRERSVLEFPHTVLCYRDKKDKIMGALSGEELELVYEAKTPDGGVRGFFLPDFLSEELVHDLMGKADPCFGVLAGENELAAAKALWERRKVGLSLQESRNHPARYALAEFVNLLSEETRFSADAPEKGEMLSILKSGRQYPAHAFSLKDPRYLFEGREISYD